jgi:hypothetical protein
VESAIGASLANDIKDKAAELFYWSSRNMEIDYVLARGKNLTPIEVKSGRRRTSLPGMDAFSREFRTRRKLLVGGDGIPIDEFLLSSVTEWIK